MGDLVLIWAMGDLVLMFFFCCLDCRGMRLPMPALPHAVWLHILGFVPRHQLGDWDAPWCVI